MTLQAERALQAEVMLRLRAWPVIALPIPNSVYFPARTDAERAVIGRVISQMKNTGMLVPGAPDLILIWRDGAAMVELKRPKASDLLGKRPAGRPTEAQIGMERRAADLGIKHAYVTSWDELHDRLGEWGVAA